EVYRRISSTQRRARSIFNEKKQEALVGSVSQKDGEGRRGRKWESPAGGLYFSFIIKDDPDSALPVSIKALMAALKTFNNMGIDMNWKWPNDLVYNGKKIGGILCEKPDRGWAIAGFGINEGIELEDLPASLRESSSVCGRIDRARYLSDLAGLLKNYQSPEMQLNKLTPDMKTFLEERLVLKGKNIKVGLYDGKVVGIEDDGRIMLDTAGGRDVRGKIKKIAYGSPTVLKSFPGTEKGAEKNILVIDIGNTSARIGYGRGLRILSAVDVSVKSQKDFSKRVIKEVQKLLPGKTKTKPEAIGLSCVAGRVKEKVVNELTGRFNLKISEVNRDNCSELKLDIKPDSVVGADRLCNAVAVRDYYGGPAVVVDLGTANTFDVIDKDGVYRGGVIAPGIESMKDTLIARADKLFDFKIEVPGSVIGADTVACLNSGFYYTLTGQINEILSRLRKEIERDFKIIFTGGGVKMLEKEYLRNFIVDPDITLNGVALIVLSRHNSVGGV
nr:biotin--[acetyl-CoA-carboxylase] ligase [Elusimicrobiota bacterium]